MWPWLLRRDKQWRDRGEKKIVTDRCSSFDIIARTEYSLKLFLSIFNFLNEHYHFNDATLAWKISRTSSLGAMFEWKMLLIGLRGFIDRFWPNTFPPKSRYGVQTRLRALLEPANIDVDHFFILHGNAFFRSTLLLIPFSLDQSSVCLHCISVKPDSFYFCNCDKVLVQFKQSKNVFVTTSLHDLGKK